MEAPVKNSKGEDAGSIELADYVWAEKMNRPVLHQVVTAQLANRRQGGHDTKTRADVISSGRKLRAQKHTGRARLGDRKSPTMRGGGVAHGPHPRSYRQRIPTGLRRLALRIALAEQLRQGNVTFVEDPGVKTPRTRAVSELLEAVGVPPNVLLVTAGSDAVLRKSANNLPNVDVQVADLLSPLQVFGARHLLFTQEAAHRVNAIWGTAPAGQARRAVRA